MTAPRGTVYLIRAASFAYSSRAVTTSFYLYVSSPGGAITKGNSVIIIIHPYENTAAMGMCPRGVFEKGEKRVNRDTKRAPFR